MKGIDFTQINKKYLEIKLQRGTIIHVLPPSVSLCGELQTVSNDINSIVGALCKILTHNKELIPITQEELESYDVDDIYLLVTTIQEFITEIVNEKH